MKPDVFVLRWFSGKRKTDYREKGGDFVERQRNAERFKSREAAKAASEPMALFGAFGPDDHVGWKVVRLTKRATR